MYAIQTIQELIYLRASNAIIRYAHNAISEIFVEIALK